MLNFPVPPVPAATAGVAWLRANVARFSDGETHTRRRAFVESELRRVRPETLRDGSGSPVARLAVALGLPSTVDADVALVAQCYQPHVPATVEADRAVGRLVTACGGVADEHTANRIGILVQAYATTALIEGRNPPVPVTRRIAPSGEIVEVDLTGRPFGEGVHACPGRAHALALAATDFHRLHYGSLPLVLPNAWDFASAAMLAEAGFPAIGTTSLGVAAAHGLMDAEGATMAETLDLAGKLVRLPVPITVDIESGFGMDPRELAAQLWELGVAGVNIEDAAGSPETHAHLIAGLKAGAPGLFVNARTDTYWLGIDRDSTLDRALRYADAGADGIFVPGLTSAPEIEALVNAIPLPLNLLAQRDIHTFADLGVRRISTGSLLFRAAMEATVRTATQVRDGLTPDIGLGYEAVQDLLSQTQKPVH